MWQATKEAANVVWPSIRDNGLEALAKLRGAFNEAIALWNSTFGRLDVDWRVVGTTIVAVTMFVTNTITKTLGTAFDIIGSILRETRGILESFYAGDIKNGFGRLAQFMVNTLITPLRFFIGLFANAMEAFAELAMKSGPLMSLMGGEQGIKDVMGFADDLGGFAKEGIKFYDTPVAGGEAGKIGFFGGDSGPMGKKVQDAAADIPGAVFEGMNALKGAINDGLDRVSTKLEEGNADRKTGNAKKCAPPKIHMDGKSVARNQAQVQQDTSDRMGFQTEPFVRRTAADQGRIGN